MTRGVVRAALRIIEILAILGALVGVALQEAPFLISLSIVAVSGLALYASVKLEERLCAN